MAYINVAEWCPDQVTDWLKGMTNPNGCFVFSSSSSLHRSQHFLHFTTKIFDKEFEKTYMNAIITSYNEFIQYFIMLSIIRFPVHK